MFAYKKIGLLLGVISLLQSCAQIDDYLLGKDNTPKPAMMAPLVSKQTLTSVWSAPVFQSSHADHYIKLKPQLSGSTLYLADTAGRVQAFDRATGKLRFSKVFKQPFVSGPAVSGDYVALGTNHSHAMLLRASDGELVWDATVSGDILSTPLFVNNAVVVKSIDGNVYAFDLKTGAQRFMVDHGTPSLILKASASPVRLGELMLVGFSDGKLDAIELQTGRVVWQRSIAYANGSSDVERLVDIDADPIVRGDLVYLASYQGEVGALSMTSGQFLWHKPASTYKNMAMDGNTLYMTDSDDVIWAYDASNGQVRWKQEALKARGVTEPVVMGHTLLVGDKTGYLHVLDANHGTLLSRFQQNAPILVAPLVVGHRVYVLTTKQLTCYSLKG